MLYTETETGVKPKFIHLSIYVNYSSIDLAYSTLVARSICILFPRRLFGLNFNLRGFEGTDVVKKNPEYSLYRVYRVYRLVKADKL